MAWNLRSKEEIQNVLRAAQSAVLEVAKRVPASPQLEAYLDGYTTALHVVAQGLGVEFEIERISTSSPRVWDEEGHLLPDSLYIGDLTLPNADDE